ncbi:hypothetical protein BXU11_16025 [Flavobacterium sp. LM5]|jgi:hypothetical protein|nr:hypothetical protein BXU11_16025 [Flavobacterium sp. LM5]
MEIKYCWRCKMDIPMLDKEEFAIASKLYSKGFRIGNENIQDRFQELLDYYNDLTGFGETEPNAIMHHAIEQIGPDCKNCGKPYRTPKAIICVACGNKRNIAE